MIPLWLKALRFYGTRAPFARGKGRITKWMYQHFSVPQTPVVAHITPRIQVELYPWLWADLCTYVIGSPEPYILAYFRSVLHPDAIVFDVGAYIGVYTFVACEILETGMIYTFEPNPDSAKRIEETITRNNVTQIQLNNSAVGDYTGTVQFSIHKTPVQSSIHNQTSQGGIEIPIITLDHYCHKQEIDRIDLLKIDVEGAELMVLRGAEKMIEMVSPLMIVELHKGESKRFGYTVAETIQFLWDAGYSLYTVKYGLTTRPRLVPFTEMEKNRQIVAAIPG